MVKYACLFIKIHVLNVEDASTNPSHFKDAQGQVGTVIGQSTYGQDYRDCLYLDHVPLRNLSVIEQGKNTDCPSQVVKGMHTVMDHLTIVHKPFTYCSHTAQ